MIIFLSSLSFSESCIEPRTCNAPYPETSDDTIENTDHFCGFLLKCGVKAGEKTTSGSEFNAKTLAEYQIGDDTALEEDSGAIPSPDRGLEDGIYSCD